MSGTESSQTVAVYLRDRKSRKKWITLPPGKSDLGSDCEFDTVDAFKRFVTHKRDWNGPFPRLTSGYVSIEYGLRHS